MDQKVSQEELALLRQQVAASRQAAENSKQIKEILIGIIVLGLIVLFICAGLFVFSLLLFDL